MRRSPMKLMWVLLKNWRMFAYNCIRILSPRRCILLWQTSTFILIIMATLTLISKQDTGVHIKCSCSSYTPTGVKEKLYLEKIMNEEDPNSGRKTIDAVRKESPTLAIDFLMRQEMKGRRCDKVPGLFSIRYNNKLWQEAKVGASTTFLLFSAFYDDRGADGAMIRILALSDSAYPPTPACHLYTSDESYFIATRAVRMDFIHWQDPLEGEWHPFLISCRAGSLAPSTVSLVGHACEAATNALVVYHSNRAKNDSNSESQQYTQLQHETNRDLDGVQKHLKNNVVLCHKFLFNELDDHSIRLIEWLEAARAWGVSKVVLYEGQVHPNVSLVLDHYVADGLVHLEPWTNPGHHPNIPSLLKAFYDTQRYALFTLENIPYADCLLKHIYSHRYVAVFDIDEFIIPAEPFTSLSDMIDVAKMKWFTSQYNKCNIMKEHQPIHNYIDNLEKLASSNISNNENIFDQNELRRKIIYSIDEIKSNTISSSCALPTSYVGLCSYFFDDIFDEPNAANGGLHLLSHLSRTVKFAPSLVFTKGIHDTRRALALHGHFALYNIDGPVNKSRDLYQLYPASEGYLGHYRSECQGDNSKELCDTEFRPFLYRDEAMMKHSKQILERSNKVISDLFHRN